MLRKIIHNTPGYVFPCHQDIPHICVCSDSPDLSTPAEFSLNEGRCSSTPMRDPSSFSSNEDSIRTDRSVFKYNR